MSKDSTKSPSPNLKNVWVCESERLLLHSPVMDIIERKCRSSEDDRPHLFYLLRSNDWCNIIPITAEGKVVLVKQYRIGISAHTLEIPGGVVDPGDSTPEVAAIRELAEETGYTPLPGARCEPLGWNFPNPAFMNNQCHSYVIGPVRKEALQKLDAGEMIEILEVPIQEIPELIQKGEIRHSLTLGALFALLLRNPQGSDSLVSGLARFTGR